MVVVSEILLQIGADIIGLIPMCIILPLTYIFGIVWGFTSRGPTGYALGLLVTPLFFFLFVSYLILIISEEGLFM